MEKRTIAAFDFDGTITTKDTLFDFIAFYKGKTSLIAGLALLSPMLILFKAGIIKNSVAKEMLFHYFFEKESADKFNKVCMEYSQRISKICNPDIIRKVNEHKSKGHTLVIVSASVTNWIAPWAISFGFDKVIGTEIEVRKGKLTGRFSSKNCYGQEKVNRLQAEFPDRDIYTLYAYGDSEGDKQLLDYSDFPTLIK